MQKCVGSLFNLCILPVQYVARRAFGFGNTNIILELSLDLTWGELHWWSNGLPRNNTFFSVSWNSRGLRPLFFWCENPTWRQQHLEHAEWGLDNLWGSCKLTRGSREVYAFAGGLFYQSKRRKAEDEAERKRRRRGRETVEEKLHAELCSRCSRKKSV